MLPLRNKTSLMRVAYSATYLQAFNKSVPGGKMKLVVPHFVSSLLKKDAQSKNFRIQKSFFVE